MVNIHASSNFVCAIEISIVFIFSYLHLFYLTLF
nr:MAG TPA: hypothetical protein [Caudoviricetes sp.]